MSGGLGSGNEDEGSVSASAEPCSYVLCVQNVAGISLLLVGSQSLQPLKTISS